MSTTSYKTGPAVTSVTGGYIGYHKTPEDLYDALAEAFGEITSEGGGNS